MKNKNIINFALVIIAITVLFGCDETESNKVIKVQHSKTYSTKIIDGELQKDTLTFEQKMGHDSDGQIMYRLILSGGYHNDTIWMGSTEKELNGKTYIYDSKGELSAIKVSRDDTTFYYNEDDELNHYIIEDKKGQRELVYGNLRYHMLDRKLDEYGNMVYLQSESSYIFSEFEYKNMTADEMAKREESYHKITITENTYEYY